jgi:thiol-disulfide isomerase/thioredoxin
MDSLLLKDDFLQSSDLRYAVILNAINASAYDHRYSRSKLLELLGQMAKNPAVNDSLHALAERIKLKLSNSGIDLTFSSLNLDFEADTAQPTLVFITAPWSTAAKKEAMVLERLLEKYPEIFQVLEIEIAEGAPGSQRPVYPWQVLRPADLAYIMDAFEVYSIPQFIWVNKNGIVEMLHTPAPSDGLEGILYKRKVTLENKNRIKVGQ